MAAHTKNYFNIYANVTRSALGILTSKVDPRTERVKHLFKCLVTNTADMSHLHPLEVCLVSNKTNVSHFYPLEVCLVSNKTNVSHFYPLEVCLVSNETNVSHFHPLEVVVRDRKTQGIQMKRKELTKTFMMTSN